MNAQEVLTMLNAHRLVTKLQDGTIKKFPNHVYTSREKVQSLLVMYTGICVSKKKSLKGPDLMHDVLFQYKRLMKIFNTGYSSFIVFTVHKPYNVPCILC